MRDEVASDLKGPRSIIWLVTSRCNLSCRHCYATRFPKEGELSEEEALNLIDQAAELGVKHIGFTGGEAFLRSDILRLMQRVHRQGIGTTVVTNGLLLSDELLEKLREYQVWVFLSLDGARKETHEKVRGPDTWETVLSAAKRMSKLGMKFSTIMAVNRLNFGEVAEGLSLARELGAAVGCLIPVIPAGRARKELAPGPREMLAALKQAEREARPDFPVSLWCLPFAGLVINSPNMFFSSCRRAKEIDLSPQGEVLLCDVLDISLGNVKEGLALAWRKQEENELTCNLTQPKLFPPCNECELREVCLGGCFARSQLLRSDIQAPDPLCPRVAGLL